MGANQEITLAAKFAGICGILTFVGVLAAVGEQDYQDALAAEQHACKMVADGLWPPHYTRNYNCPALASTSNSALMVAGVAYE